MSPGPGNQRRQDGQAVRTGQCPTPAKVCYRTKRSAKLALSRARGVKCRATMRAYWCTCGTWHLGHKPGSRKQRPRPGYPDCRRAAPGVSARKSSDLEVIADV